MIEERFTDQLSLTDSVLTGDNREAQELAYGLLNDQEIIKHVLKKGARGFAKCTLMNKQISFGTPNLVLLRGREFLAQKLADVPQSSTVDNRHYKIRYFGYGSGGAQEGTGTVPNKMGPFDDDTGLYAPAHFASGSSDADTQYKYIQDGYLKLIRTDYGKIAIEEEAHTINKGTGTSGTGTGTSVESIVNRYTAIKYTMFIMSHEFIKLSTEGAVTDNPFAFNEAALYAVAMEEILNEDGTMARRPDLEKFAQEHNLKLGTVADLIEYRNNNETTIERVSGCKLPTEFGEFDLVAYQDTIDKQVHFALVNGAIKEGDITNVRVHLQNTFSDNFFSDRFGTRTWPLNNALQRLAQDGGVLVMLGHQETAESLLEQVKQIAQQDAGNGQALFFTLAQADPTFTDQGMDAVG